MNEKERLAKIKSMKKELAELKKVKPKLDSRFEMVGAYDDRWFEPNFGSVSQSTRAVGIIVVTRGDANFKAGTYAGGHPGENFKEGAVDITHGCYVLSKNGRRWKTGTQNRTRILYLLRKTILNYTLTQNIFLLQ